MSIDLIVTITIGIVTILVSYFIARHYFQKGFSIGLKDERTKRARKEVVQLISQSIKNSNKEIPFSIIESWIRSKYLDNKVDFNPTTELPIIVDDLITLISEDSFISQETKELLQEKTLAIRRLFETRESNLEDILEEWDKYSIFSIIFKSISVAYLTFLLGFAVMIVSYFVSSLFGFPIDTTNLYSLIALISVLTISTGIIRYRTLMSDRSEISIDLNRTIEDIGTDAITRILANVQIEKNTLNSDGNLVRADLIINSDGMRIPVEVKHGIVNESTIEQLTRAMKELTSNKGIIISAKKANNKIIELAKTKNIIIIENIISEEDIIRELQHTNLFD